MEFLVLTFVFWSIVLYLFVSSNVELPASLHSLGDLGVRFLGYIETPGLCMLSDNEAISCANFLWNMNEPEDYESKETGKSWMFVPEKYARKFD